MSPTFNAEEVTSVPFSKTATISALVIPGVNTICSCFTPPSSCWLVLVTCEALTWYDAELADDDDALSPSSIIEDTTGFFCKKISLP